MLTSLSRLFSLRGALAACALLTLVHLTLHHHHARVTTPEFVAVGLLSTSATAAALLPGEGGGGGSSGGAIDTPRAYSEQAGLAKRTKVPNTGEDSSRSGGSVAKESLGASLCPIHHRIDGESRKVVTALGTGTWLETRPPLPLAPGKAVACAAERQAVLHRKCERGSPQGGAILGIGRHPRTKTEPRFDTFEYPMY